MAGRRSMYLLCVGLALLLAGMAQAEVYARPEDVPGAVLNPDVNYWSIHTKEEDGSLRLWYIFMDNESETAYFFVPGAEISQWDDPRSDEEIAAARMAHQTEAAEDYDDNEIDDGEEEYEEAEGPAGWDFPFDFPDVSALDQQALLKLAPVAVAVLVVAIAAAILRCKEDSDADAKPVKKVAAAPRTPARKKAVDSSEVAEAEPNVRVTRSAVKRRQAA